MMMVKDLVCGMEIDSEAAEAREIHHGISYFFCSEECRQKFEQEPDRYIEMATAEQRGSSGR